MRVASITEAKNNLSALLDQVREGQTILITDRDRPVARLEPVHARQEGSVDGRLERLERAGLVRRRGTGRINLKALSKDLPQSKASVLEALLEERREGR